MMISKEHPYRNKTQIKSQRKRSKEMEIWILII